MVTVTNHVVECVDIFYRADYIDIFIISHTFEARDHEALLLLRIGRNQGPKRDMY